LESLRAYSTTTLDLLAALQRIASMHAALVCPAADIVHFDVNPANILAARDRITGVIDWEGAGAGDAAFDLATLLFYAYDEPEPRARLWQAARARASDEAFALYLAHLILRQVDWSIRHHDAATVRHYLSIASNVLRVLEHI
jgi:aminoglycoside phosphotransferase (APT) family kinase protein